MGKDKETYKGDDGKVLIVERNSKESGKNAIDIFIKDTNDSKDSNKGHFWVSNKGDSGVRELKSEEKKSGGSGK